VEIHTLDLVKSSNLCYITANEDIVHILSAENKVINLLSLGSKATIDMYELLPLKPRTIRQALCSLENKGIVKRKKGVVRNSAFRFSDSWTLAGESSIQTKTPKDMACIWYKSLHHGNTYRYHSSFIPEIIDIDKIAAVAAGFFMAEGTKKRPRGIEIVNSEPLLLDLFLTFFERLGINRSMWSSRIAFNQKLKKHFSSDTLESHAKVFWDEKCNILAHKIVYAGTSIGKMRKSTPTCGSLNITYSNVLMRNFFFLLLEKVKLLALKSEELATNFLKGYVSGEAYVGASDRELQIACVNKEERELAIRLFNKIGIKCSVSTQTSTAPPKILVTYLDGFRILYHKDIFEFHPHKKRNLLLKILRYKTITADERKSICCDLTKVEFMLKNRYKLKIKSI